MAAFGLSGVKGPRRRPIADAGDRIRAVSNRQLHHARRHQYARDVIDFAGNMDVLRTRNLMKRLGEPHEVASAAPFLGSDDASFIPGEIFSVSGGVWPSL